MENNIEIWKDIPGYEGKYQASSMGRIRSIFRYKIILTPSLKKGYNNYNIKDKYGKYRTIRGNRLVASAFLGLDINNIKLFSCHKNDIRNDDRTDNLFIGTASDNMKDCVSKGRSVDNKGFKNGMCKYTETAIIDVISLIKNGLGNTRIEQLTGVNNKVVSDVRHKKRWKLLSNKFCL